MKANLGMADKVVRILAAVVIGTTVFHECDYRNNSNYFFNIRYNPGAHQLNKLLPALLFTGYKDKEKNNSIIKN